MLQYDIKFLKGGTEAYTYKFNLDAAPESLSLAVANAMRIARTKGIDLMADDVKISIERSA